MDLWKLPPIVGEIIDNKVAILFELVDLSSLLTYSIKGHKKSHVMTLEPSGPTRLLLKFKKPGTYIVQWMINNHLSYQHPIIISNRVKKLIFTSCDFLEADTTHSLWTTMQHELSDERVAIV